jgi:hypothetical protein
MVSDSEHMYPQIIRKKVNAINLSNAIHLFLRLSNREYVNYQGHNKGKIKSLFHSQEKTHGCLMDYFSEIRNLTISEIKLLFSELFDYYLSVRIKNEFLNELFQFYKFIVSHLGLDSEIFEKILVTLNQNAAQTENQKGSKEAVLI